MESWGISTRASVAVQGLRFETVEYQPGHWAERHAHDVAYLDLLLCGAQKACWNGADVRRTPGTLALMPIGEAHATSSVLPTRTFQVSIDPSWWEHASGTKPLNGSCEFIDVGPVAWGMTRLWAEFRHQDDLTPTILEERLRGFLDTLMGGAHTAGEAMAPWLRQAHDFVKSHSVRGFSVAEVATEVGVDPAHLMRSYVRRYGITLGEEARRFRVAHACRLLADPQLGLGGVALSAGFADQSHLNRVFKGFTGLTPREYRQTCLG